MYTSTFLHLYRVFINPVENKCFGSYDILGKFICIMHTCIWLPKKLDQSAVVWHSSLSQKNRNDLERVQKSAVRCILGDNYKGYENALES